MDILNIIKILEKKEIEINKIKNSGFFNITVILNFWQISDFKKLKMKVFEYYYNIEKNENLKKIKNK